MKKYTLILIPVILILLYVNILSSESNAGCEGPVLSITDNHNLPPDWHCLCDPYIPLTFDDASTPDEIDAGSGVSIFIKYGCPPFKWEVSGKGYTWNASGSGTTTYETNNRSVELYCDTGT